MNPPTVSVVIPAYNAAVFLVDTVRSVIEQTVRDWELLIVDDGSDDPTPSIAARFARDDSRIRVLVGPNLGVAGARNAGLAMASTSSRFVAFLDHDDLWHPYCLEVLAGVLDAHPAASAAYGLPRPMTSSGVPVASDVRQAVGYRRWCVHQGRVVEWPPELPTTFEVLTAWNVIETPGQVLIRRAALESVDPFDPDCVPGDDWDMWLRLSLVGHLQLTVRHVIDKRYHENAQSFGFGLFGSERRLRKKWVGRPDLSPEQRATLKVADRHGPVLRLRWARDEIRRGDLYWAVRHVGSAAIAYRRYLAMPY